MLWSNGFDSQACETCSARIKPDARSMCPFSLGCLWLSNHAFTSVQDRHRTPPPPTTSMACVTLQPAVFPQQQQPFQQEHSLRLVLNTKCRETDAVRGPRVACASKHFKWH